MRAKRSLLGIIGMAVCMLMGRLHHRTGTGGHRLRTASDGDPALGPRLAGQQLPTHTSGAGGRLWPAPRPLTCGGPARGR